MNRRGVLPITPPRNSLCKFRPSLKRRVGSGPQICRWKHDEDLAIGEFQNVFEGNFAFALFGLALAAGEQAAKAAVSRATHGIGQCLEPIGGDEPYAHEKSDVRILCCDVATD